MRFLNQFIRAMVVSQAAAVAMLLLGGWVMDMAYTGRRGECFFSYRVQGLDGFPFWFGSILALSVINGLYLFRLAMVEGGVSTPFRGGPWGEYRLSVPLNPLRMVAVDLVFVPILLFVSVVARQHGW